MKLSSVLTIALVGMMTAGAAPFKTVNPLLSRVSAQEIKGATKMGAKMTPEEQIFMIIKSKGQFGSGDQLRRYFFGDLEPIAVQPGGAGMVVNLYNKANDVTFAYCATYDVIVAVKKGKVTAFLASEVK